MPLYFSRNIFINKNKTEPEINLGDFGISKLVENGVLNDEHTLNIGTIDYMSPELRGGFAVINESIDIWY